MTVKHVAELLEVSVSCGYELCARGDIAHYRVGKGRGTVRIDEADAHAYKASLRREVIPAETRPVKLSKPTHALAPNRDGRSTVRLLDALRALRDASQKKTN